MLAALQLPGKMGAQSYSLQGAVREHRHPWPVSLVLSDAVPMKHVITVPHVKAPIVVSMLQLFHPIYRISNYSQHTVCYFILRGIQFLGILLVLCHPSLKHSLKCNHLSHLPSSFCFFHCRASQLSLSIMSQLPLSRSIHLEMLVAKYLLVCDRISLTSYTGICCR